MYLESDIFSEYLEEETVFEAVSLVETDVDRQLESQLNDITFTEDNSGEVVDDVVVRVIELLCEEYADIEPFNDFNKAESALRDEIEQYVDDAYLSMADEEIEDLLRDLHLVEDLFTTATVGVITASPEDKNLPEDYVNFLFSEDVMLDIDEDPIDTFEKIEEAMLKAARLLDISKYTMTGMADVRSALFAMNRLYSYREQ